MPGQMKDRLIVLIGMDEASMGSVRRAAEDDSQRRLGDVEVVMVAPLSPCHQPLFKPRQQPVDPIGGELCQP